MSRSEEFSPGPFWWDDEGDEGRDEFGVGVRVAAGGTLRDANGDSLIQTDSGYYPPYGKDRSLFAAAPEMLAALKAVWFSTFLAANEDDQAVMLQVRAAIEKAEAIPTPSPSE